MRYARFYLINFLLHDFLFSFAGCCEQSHLMRRKEYLIREKLNWLMKANEIKTIAISDDKSGDFWLALFRITGFDRTGFWSLSAVNFEFKTICWTAWLEKVCNKLALNIIKVNRYRLLLMFICVGSKKRRK